MKKILVVEDEAQVRDNIQEILELEDFETIAAENGLVGLQLARKQVPDLIICDVMMPEMDGYGVLTALRQDLATATIPLIFLTAKADKSDLRQGMELGADDYLTKPFTPNELLKAIATQLEKQAAVNRQSQKQLDDLRSSIALSLPHELHTPLNGIIGTSQLLIENYSMIEEAEVLEMLKTIHTSGEQLYKLTQNFLLYTKLELIATDPKQIEALQNNREKSYSKAMITEVALQKAQQAGREADLQLELQDLTVQISELKLKKIVAEIIDNAFKFSPTGTPVRIISNLSGNNFHLNVIDCGRGMTNDQIAGLGAYMQFERKLYEQQGSGLGLQIAKRLVELHGGKLTIRSIPGKKTIVRIALRR